MEAKGGPEPTNGFRPLPTVHRSQGCRRLARQRVPAGDHPAGDSHSHSPCRAESCPKTPNRQNEGISADRRYLYQFSGSGHAATANLASGEIRQIEDFCRDTPIASALSPDGRFLVAATWHELSIHDFASRKTTRISNDPHWAKTIVFSPDGTLMITGGIDGHIVLRRLPDFSLAWKLNGHLSEVSGSRDLSRRTHACLLGNRQRPALLAVGHPARGHAAGAPGSL